MPRRFVALIAVAWLSGVALIEARAQHGRSQPSHAGWPERIEGFGLDLSAAKGHAYLSACREVETYLERLQPPIKAWRPTVAYIRAHMVDSEAAGPDLPLDPGIARRWVLLLKPPDLDSFRRLDESKHGLARDEHRRQRLATFARMIVGVLLLVVIAGAGCRRTHGQANRSRDPQMLPERAEKLAI
ncbi:MAG: hypothetical protein FJ271_09975 [Planctomycetes bacterium]|nr:hypothetical protein [Planctomycetota bacterium]